MKLDAYIEYIQNWLIKKNNDAKTNGVVIGISGGIDSAVVAAIAKKAFPKNHLTIFLPCYSSDLDKKCYEKLVEDLKLNHITFNLEETFDKFINTNKNNTFSKMAIANTKARLRMTTLYAYAQTNNYLVLGTDNAPEWHLGYFTKFGDGGVDLLPIIHLLKREVKSAASLLGIPKLIIDRQPTASLFEDQTDESELGFKYDEIDDYLCGKKIEKSIIEKIEKLHNASEHKRKSADIPKSFNRGE